MMNKPAKPQFVWHGSDWQGIGTWEYPKDWKRIEGMRAPIFKGYRFGIFEIRVYNTIVEGRIFCSDCRWYDDECFGSKCVQPLNLDEVKDFERAKIVTVKRPHEINNDNKCKLFQRKSFWSGVKKFLCWGST